MENLIIIIMGSFLPLALLTFFAENNSSMAQPQMGQPPLGKPRPGGASIQGLETYTLPPGVVTDNDMPQIKTTIQQVLAKISESKISPGNRVDRETIKSCILTFQDWLRVQGCISRASTTYDIEKSDTYSENVFITYPGQLPFDIVFKMEGDVQQPYRLLIFVTTYDLFNFGSLVANNSKEEVVIPENWPKDAMSYWEGR
jgi:hypothetical protein